MSSSEQVNSEVCAERFTGQLLSQEPPQGVQDPQGSIDFKLGHYPSLLPWLAFTPCPSTLTHMWCPYHPDCPPLVAGPMVSTPESLPECLPSWLSYESVCLVGYLPGRPRQSPRWMNREQWEELQGFYWHLGKLRPRETFSRLLRLRFPLLP